MRRQKKNLRAAAKLMKFFLTERSARPTIGYPTFVIICFRIPSSLSLLLTPQRFGLDALKEGGGGGGMNPADIFSQFFGGGFDFGGRRFQNPQIASS